MKDLGEEAGNLGDADSTTPTAAWSFPTGGSTILPLPSPKVNPDQDSGKAHRFVTQVCIGVVDTACVCMCDNRTAMEEQCSSVGMAIMRQKQHGEVRDGEH